MLVIGIYYLVFALSKGLDKYVEWKQNILDYVNKYFWIRFLIMVHSAVWFYLLWLLLKDLFLLHIFQIMYVYQRILFNYNILDRSKKCFIVETDLIFNRISDITYLTMSKKFGNRRVFDSPFPVEPGMVILELSNNFLLFIRLN